MSESANTSSWKHIAWLPVNAALSFVLPNILLRQFRIPFNLYCVVLAMVVAAAIWYYARASKIKWSGSLKPGWALGLIFGVFFGLAFMSLTSASRPNLHALILNSPTIPLILQGPLYGLASSLLISGLPFVITWRALAGTNPGNLRKAAVTTAAVLAIASNAALYNIGMPDSNGSIGQRIKNSLAASIPTIVSGNPLASPISNMFLQVSQPVALSIEKSSEIAGKPRETNSKTSPGGAN